jgi:hypothetical protein
MKRSIGIRQDAPRAVTLAALFIFGAALAGCGGDTAPTDEGEDNGGAGGSSTAAGGTGGQRSESGGSGGAKPPVGPGDSGGSGGADVSTGGTSGGDGGSTGEGGSTPDAAIAGEDGPGAPEDASPSTGDDGGPANKNPCPAKVTNYTLNGLSVSDFCDAYEKYCKYTPDGSMKSKCGPGQKIGPLFLSRADCEMQYMSASAGGKACRAGQLCQNAPRGLTVNACSHATGYCAPACGK